jgi:hypothetical protein
MLASQKSFFYQTIYQLLITQNYVPTRNEVKHEATTSASKDPLIARIPKSYLPFGQFSTSSDNMELRQITISTISSGAICSSATYLASLSKMVRGHLLSPMTQLTGDNRIVQT